MVVMKKFTENLILLLVLCLALCTAFSAVSVCFAESSIGEVFYYVEGKSFVSPSQASQSDTIAFVVRSYQADGISVMQMSGFYFGDISATVEIYSSDDFVIDFGLLEQVDGERLVRQTKVKDALLYAHQTLTHVNAIANTQVATSDVALYNAMPSGQKLQIDYDTYKMFELARSVYDQTDGAFNPAVYRLVDLWGFSSRIYSNGNYGLPYDRRWSDGSYPLPEQKYVDAFREASFTDFSQNAVTLEQNGDNYFVTKNAPSVTVDGVSYSQWVDFGGIAKGYAADLIESYLNNGGMTSYYVDVGSSSTAIGSQNLSLALIDPYDEWAQVYASTYYAGVGVCQNDVSTSGQYVRKYVTNGVEYSHIIDGTKGAPAQTGVKTVTVVAPKGDFWSAKGDCLTTALTVMGRSGIVDFFNSDYVKQSGLKIIVVYETTDGGRQILSNYEKSELITDGTTFENFGWAVTKTADGTYVYDASSVVFPTHKADLTWLIVTLAVALGLAVVASVVIAFVRKTPRTEKILATKSGKLFKTADVAVYLLVALLIVSLFGAFFGKGAQTISLVSVCDMQSGETIFVYNTVRNEYTVSECDGWTVECTRDGDVLTVHCAKTFDGEQRFNDVKITTGAKTSVVMQDSLCGHSQDCVRIFGTVTKGGGTIVCSPNRLKVITE